MVSPADKNGSGLHTEGVMSSPDGSVVRYGAGQAFGDASGGGIMIEYLGYRGASAWSGAHAISPFGPTPPNIAGAAQNYFFSPDLSASILATDLPFDPVATPGYHYYRQATATNQVEILSKGDVTPPLDIAERRGFAGASSDLTRVYFYSSDNRTSDATGTDLKLYESRNGALRLAGIVGGVQAPGSAMPAGDNGFLFGTRNVVSEDGARAFFVAPAETDNNGQPNDPTGALYLREDNLADPARTVWVNEPQRPDSGPDPEGPGAARFLWATPDGNVVFFSSCEKLTEDATAVGMPEMQAGRCGDFVNPLGRHDLYRYDVESGVLTDLTTTDPEGAGVRRVLGISDDGSRVYFTATGVLAPEATAGSQNIYLYENGAVRHIASVEEAFGLVNDINSGKLPHERVTPDGRFLLFLSRDRLTEYDNASPVCPVGYGCAQAYLFDAEAAGDGLVCASCDPSGAVSRGAALFDPGTNASLPIRTVRPNRALTLDGSKVFFSSPDRLVAGDSNEAYDAYEYDVASGTVALVSAGRGPGNAFFGDASADGEDVFFLTRLRLSGRDSDETIDLYNARLGDAFSEPPSPAPPCAGEECRGSLPSAAAAATLGSSLPGEGERSCVRLKRKPRNAKARTPRAQGKTRKQKARAQRERKQNVRKQAKKRQVGNCEGGNR
ncbi:MAG TPA: hypothetical protein VFX85_09590 [Solirubrobacterales bacterium]|nr:hypothetical protein [Solirubrobacterales bacterium]